MENKNRTEQEERLQNKSGQLRLNGFGRNKTWDMKEGKTRQHLRRTEKSMQSGSPEERLRNLGRELQNSNKKLEKLDRNRRVVRKISVTAKEGAPGSGLKERTRGGRLSSRTYSRLLKRANPGLDTAGTGFVRVQFRPAVRKDYQKEHSRIRRRENRNYAGGRLLFREAGKALGNDKESGGASTDSMMKEGAEAARETGRLLYKGGRRAVHRLQENYADTVNKRFDAELLRYNRLQADYKRLSERKESLKGEPALRQDSSGRGSGHPDSSPEGTKGRNGSAGNNGRQGSGRRNPSAAPEAYKQRAKKRQITENHRQDQKSTGRRASQHRQKAKKKAREKAVRTKHTITSLASGTGAALLLAGGAAALIFVLLIIINSGASIGTAFVSMNDYKTMTEATNYFSDKCTCLYMYLNIDCSEGIEPDLEEELEEDIYEFKYDVSKPITYSQIDLVAYLSAKYGTFTLDDTVKKELDEIFEKMFKVDAETKEEEREVTDPETGEKTKENKEICYVTLNVTSFEDAIAGRLTEGQKNSYLGYKLSSCGQQVMNPVMEENWAALISSPFGSRYHPIHKEYRMHNGVDIAVPTGTKIYSAVSGEVTAAGYSDSAGYYVSIRNQNGYTVTYMHLYSYTAAAGQKISAGQMVALSGNTGNSTGPHLHLAVQDAEGGYLNPVFMIPQACAGQGQ